jgi:predicted deacylase
VDPNDVTALVNGVRGVMAYLKMTASGPKPAASPTWVEKIATVSAEQDGIFYPEVQRDAHVAKGAKLGVVRDYWGKVLAEPVAPDAGIIMFVRALPTLRKGDTIANIGIVRR